MTENAHAVTAEAALPAASDSSFTKNGRQLSGFEAQPYEIVR
ncbi:hypothetical protein [Escherichia coli]|nr:hypothetical protein [Escherichia coli]